MIHPLRVYGAGLLAGEVASPKRGHAVAVRLSDGSAAPLALDRYLGPADAIDESLLASVRGPVLDVGCGPGRHLHALARRGVFGLGVDLSRVAVELARDRGARAIVASIFDELPGAGTWRTALLLDGNIGIGGGPVRLLARVGALLAEGGELLVELDPPGVRTGPVRARLEADGAASLWFDWARVAFGDVEPIARDAGLTLRRQWRSGDRWFARLVCHRDRAVCRA
jgi:SAM-dependent methyltransferase